MQHKQNKFGGSSRLLLGETKDERHALPRTGGDCWHRIACRRGHNLRNTYLTSYLDGSADRLLTMYISNTFLFRPLSIFPGVQYETDPSGLMVYICILHCITPVLYEKRNEDLDYWGRKYGPTGLCALHGGRAAQQTRQSLTDILYSYRVRVAKREIRALAGDARYRVRTLKRFKTSP